MYTTLGIAATLLGCISLYLSSKNQRWLAARWPAWPARAGSMVLVVLGWLAFARDMQRVPASFALVTLVMLALSVLPYVGALRKPRGRR
jgi:hypothetical protein